MDLTWIAVPIAIAIAPLILGLVFVIRKMLKVDGIEEELREMHKHAYNGIHDLQLSVQSHLAEADSRDKMIKERVDRIEERINRKWNGVSKHD